MQHTGPVYDTFMRHAIDLARRATRQTAPNPCVGAVLVHNGCVVAEGWHKGPEVEQIMDPIQAGKVLGEIAKKARKNAGMNGLDLD